MTQPATVHSRIEHVRSNVTTVQLVVGLALVAAIGFTLLFLQEPMVHESLHHFRHSAGITCH